MIAPDFVGLPEAGKLNAQMIHRANPGIRVFALNCPARLGGEGKDGVAPWIGRIAHVQPSKGVLS
jgi:hypothetical protein